MSIATVPTKLVLPDSRYRDTMASPRTRFRSTEVGQWTDAIKVLAAKSVYPFMSNYQSGRDLDRIRDEFDNDRIYTVGTTHGTAGFCIDKYGMITGPKLLFLSDAKTIDELLRSAPELIATWKLVQQTDMSFTLWLHATIMSDHAYVGFSWRKTKGDATVIRGVFSDKKFKINTEKYPKGGMSVYVNIDTDKAVMMPIHAFLQLFANDTEKIATCKKFFNNFCN